MSYIENGGPSVPSGIPDGGRDSNDRAFQTLQTTIREEIAKAEHDFADESDIHVIRDERAFRARFRFDWPRRYRLELVRLKHQLDLTDKEIRWLHATGDLRDHPDGVRLVNHAWIALYGRSITILFGGLAVLSFLTLLSHRPASVAQVSLGLLIVLSYVVLSWVTDQIFVRPRRIWCRTRQHLSGNQDRAARPEEIRKDDQG